MFDVERLTHSLTFDLFSCNFPLAARTALILAAAAEAASRLLTGGFPGLDGLLPNSGGACGGALYPYVFGVSHLDFLNLYRCKEKENKTF